MPFVKCSYCTDSLNSHTTDCIVSVEPYGDRDIHYFCTRDDYCAHELQRQSNRKGAFHGLCKQGEDMITSSNKRLKAIHAGDNVMISILVVDRAPPWSDQSIRDSNEVHL